MNLVTSVPTVAALFVLATTAGAADFEVGQKDKTFTHDSLSIQIGQSVSFKNEDDFFHNIFSLSDAATFDLGSFPQGEHREVTFDTAGTVEVECAIHPSMTMTIDVNE